MQQPNVDDSVKSDTGITDLLNHYQNVIVDTDEENKLGSAVTSTDHKSTTRRSNSGGTLSAMNNMIMQNIAVPFKSNIKQLHSSAAAYWRVETLLELCHNVRPWSVSSGGP